MDQEQYHFLLIRTHLSIVLLNVEDKKEQTYTSRETVCLNGQVCFFGSFLFRSL